MDPDEFEYRPMRVRGKFDHSTELLMKPKPLLDERRDRGAGLVSAGNVNAGAWVVTPFVLSESGYVWITLVAFNVSFLPRCFSKKSALLKVTCCSRVALLCLQPPPPSLGLFGAPTALLVNQKIITVTKAARGSVASTLVRPCFVLVSAC